MIDLSTECYSRPFAIRRRAACCLLPLLLLAGNAEAQTAVPCFGGDEPYTAETLPEIDLDSGRPCRLPTTAERAARRGDYPPGSAENSANQTAPAPIAPGWNGQGVGNASRGGANSQGFGGQGSGAIQGGTFGNKNGSPRGNNSFGNTGTTNSYGSSRSSGNTAFPGGSPGSANTAPSTPTGYESYGGTLSEPTGYESYATPGN